MWKRWLRVSAIVALILVPIGIWMLYQKVSELPKQITIAAGAKGGRYRVLAESLKDEIDARLGVKVVILETEGSLENLLSLRTGKADLAFYQPGTIEILREHDRDLVEQVEHAAGLRSADEGVGNVTFVTNLYMQPAHLVVRRDAQIEQPSDLNQRQVSVGLAQSGDHAVSLILLDHFGLEQADITPRHLPFDQIVTGMTRDDLDEPLRLDAACNAVAAPSPVAKELFASEKCNILEIPFTKALAMKHVYLSEFTIPAGFYHSESPPRPERDIKTVALPAQLLAHKDVDLALIQQITAIALDKRFARQNDLHELFTHGKEFAQTKPEFSIHPGAQSLFDPEFDIHLIESWEAGYSLTASILIAAFFGVREIQRRKEKRSEHRLDQFIRSLLDIEKREVDLDRHASANDLDRLQELLDEVTALRHFALCEFSIHELNEDRGTDCFLEMCHGLSTKINAKISRQRLDLAMRQLMDALPGAPS